MNILVLAFVVGAMLVPGLVWAQERWMAPAEAKGVGNPLPRSEEVLARGRLYYNGTTYGCKDCHGRQGHGDGVAASAFSPRPPDFASADVQAQTDGELFWKIAHGREPMPSYGRHPEEDLWALVHFIRTLNDPRSPGRPAGSRTD